ncbi:hypothetical protein PtA15_18A337 [Puccinia triticina]|uniref:Uncharacterized protein n=1 Tax=Puccinia triticina TaxID=208348 RepID=A0ABY7D916_9BASI|nr:uncharacterized protein PtA15_18A337 [Puccinia triticina]WAQ93279.1 hypothetical protein PtA15_18A337 [Puccinia triticina]WAR63268.1 hypothetical protein PtB15_18B350 [Puccinia triticina]
MKTTKMTINPRLLTSLQTPKFTITWTVLKELKELCRLPQELKTQLNYHIWEIRMLTLTAKIIQGIQQPTSIPTRQAKGTAFLKMHLGFQGPYQQNKLVELYKAWQTSQSNLPAQEDVPNPQESTDNQKIQSENYNNCDKNQLEKLLAPFPVSTSGLSKKKTGVAVQSICQNGPANETLPLK